MDNQAGKPERETPTTIPLEGSRGKRSEVGKPKRRDPHGEDIVCAYMKV